MATGRMMHRLRTVVIRVVAGLVIIGSLAASPLSMWLAWGVLYPDIDQIGSTETFDAIVVLSGEDRRIESGLELAEVGRAPVLVAMYGELWAGTRDQCGTKTMFETLCPVPPEDSTRGEAQLIAELAQENGWATILIVTADYHVSRARLLIERCVGNTAQISYETIQWPDLRMAVVRDEIMKTAHAKSLDRTC